MQIINLKTASLDEAIIQTTKILAKGGLVIYPTETVYGAGVDATNQTAVNKLLAYKSRREGKPLSIAVTNEEMAKQYAEVNQQAHNIYQRFLPGPITVISQVKTQNQLAKGVASEFNTIGIRMPNYPLISRLVTVYQKPITATSANASGEKRPYNVQNILDNLSDKQKNLIDLILDAGQLPPNKPSTVIDTTLSTPVTMRQGDFKLDETKQLKIKNNAAWQKNYQLTESYTLHSHSEAETQGIAGRILLKHWDEFKTTGVVIGLNGQLGAGKTIFTKGAAKFLGINDILRSPTYNYWFDYNFIRHQTQGKLIHADVWKVDQAELFQKIELLEQIKKNQLVVIEWFNQIENFIDKSIKTPIVLIKIEFSQTDIQQRTLQVQEYLPSLTK